jgi:G patch domain and KOW motifs-containing protein
VQTGLATLRGMGWNEKNGIGLTNKRKVDTIEVEIRPKGLGLGSRWKKPDNKESTTTTSSQTELKYVKGAFIQIIRGKCKDEFGQLVSFDDGLDRILVKISTGPNKGETISVMQFNTELITKDKYEKETKSSRRH